MLTFMILMGMIFGALGFACFIGGIIWSIGVLAYLCKIGVVIIAAWVAYKVFFD